MCLKKKGYKGIIHKLGMGKPRHATQKEQRIKKLIQDLKSGKIDKVRAALVKIRRYTPIKDRKLHARVMEAILIAHNNTLPIIFKCIQNPDSEFYKNKLRAQSKLRNAIVRLIEKLGYKTPMDMVRLPGKSDTGTFYFIPAPLSPKDLKGKRRRMKQRIVKQEPQKDNETPRKVFSLRARRRIRSDDISGDRLSKLLGKEWIRRVQTMRRYKPEEVEIIEKRGQPKLRIVGRVPKPPRLSLIPSIEEATRTRDAEARRQALRQRIGWDRDPRNMTLKQMVKYRMREYGKMNPLAVPLIFGSDSFSVVQIAINRGLNFVLAPTLGRGLKALSGEDPRAVAAYQRYKNRRDIMQREYPEVMRTGRADRNFVQMLAADHHIIGVDDQRLLKKIIRNKQNDIQTKIVAIHALRSVGKRIIPFLKEIFNNKRYDRNVRVAAAGVLLSIDENTANELKRDLNIYYLALGRREVLRLGGGTPNKSAIRELKHGLKDQKLPMEERLEIASILTVIDIGEGTRFLAKSLAHKSQKIQQRAIAHLRLLGWKRSVIQAVLPVLRHKEARVRKAALLALESNRSMVVVKAVSRQLKDSNKGVCVVASNVLGEMAFYGSTSMNKAEQQSGRYAKRRLEIHYRRGGIDRIIAAIGMQKFEDMRAIKPIFQGLKHGNANVRSMCVSALSFLMKHDLVQAKRVVNALYSLKDDQSMEVRVLAVSVLTRLVDEKEIWRRFIK